MAQQRDSDSMQTNRPYGSGLQQPPLDQSQLKSPQISLPRGGGAIRGIGEKFGTNPITGTGSMTVPIATSPGRGGFGPQLALSYDSGAGNGPFGFGWNLSLPSITRKTDKGLPKYQDANESDVFILSGAEDLVPVFKQDSNRERDANDRLVTHDEVRTVAGISYRVRRYRPRIEGLFARIERWTNSADPKDTFWRSISKDNITTWYGKSETSRIVDSEDASRIFRWLMCESYDDKGNAIAYQYVSENDDNIDRTQVNERNRVRTSNRYLKRIQYGNRTSRLTQPDLTQMEWMFEVVFDYDDGHYEELDFDSARPVSEQHWFVRASASRGNTWTVRPDVFSTYRAGFEVRTYRRCHRVLMFHRFAELGSEPCLVRATEFEYADLDYSQPTAIESELSHQGSTRFASFIRSVIQSGFVRDGTQAVLERNGAKYVTYLKKSLPRFEFEYSKASIRDDIREMDLESLENFPYGLDSTNYQWVDLDGEGLSGILTEQADGWFYKRNLSPINQVNQNGSTRIEARFSPVELVAEKPSLAAISQGRQQLMDLSGDGQLDLVELHGPTPGFYERTQDGRWESFKPFVSQPVLDWSNPNLKFVDLTGDGHADILMTEDDVFTWHPSLEEDGFGPAERTHHAWDEEKTPRLVFADGTQSIYLADMSGDGLTDLVRIRNGEVCYWPNLGYGRFGAKVTMDNAPWFDRPDQFNQQQVRLADIDGSGVIDIIYLGGDGVRLYFNQSGNHWSEPRYLRQFPTVDSLSSVMTVDLLGNGTACLVWSSALLGDARRPMRYVDLMGGQKPHLLVKTINNLGAEIHVQYAPSTEFYLADKLTGKPWITKVPFPVHVVKRIETYDHISRNRFVTRYVYHHGYFDGQEREFRGFGMVEQWDTEEFATLSKSDDFPVSDNIQAPYHIPPVYTKTWFHTGVYLDRDHISDFFAGLLDDNDEGEYYREPGSTDAQARALLLPDTVLPPDWTPEEEREACRALKGAMLRQEVYALDQTPKQDHPYTVTEQNHTVRRLQPRDGNRHGVFLTHPREVINFHYERSFTFDSADPEPDPQKKRKIFDPRVQHTFTFAVNDFGNVLKSATVAYGRRYDAPDLALLSQDLEKQRLVHITCTENTFTNSIEKKADDYRTPLPAESLTYEVRKPRQEKSGNGLTNLYRFDALLNHINQAGDGNHDVAYEDILFARAQQAAANDATESEKYFRRLIEHVRTLYRPNDCGVAQNNPLALLPLGSLESLALPGESYKLAFTPGLLAQVFQRNSQPLLSNPANVLGGPGADGGGYVVSQDMKGAGNFPNTDADDYWWVPTGRVFLSPNSTNDAAHEFAYARSHFFLPHRVRDPFHTSAVSTESFVTYDNYNLLVVKTRDARDNVVTVATKDDTGNAGIRINYRVLQPYWVTDPNGNRTQVGFDALGMVVATAVMGKPGENLGDLLEDVDADPLLAVLQDFIADPQGKAASLLGKATTRILYDLERYERAGQPPFAATLARETHFHDAGGDRTKIQIGFSYSDGFGREIQKKIQAEAGKAPQREADMPMPTGDIRPGDLVRDAEGKPIPANTLRRWVGTGRTVFNNKGKPVKQYEPFFSTTQLYEPEREMTDTGVSPILFYDPVERVVATLHPNHTYEKIVFNSWRQVTYDVNDTTTPPTIPGDPPFDPKNDIDVGHYFGGIPDEEYLPTWYDVRTNAAKALKAWPDTDPHNIKRRAAEKSAVAKAVAHADTPSTVHFDSLGRPFLTVALNRWERTKEDGTKELVEEPPCQTRIELDIEGNQRAVRDAIVQNGDQQGRIVMRYDYDMLGNRIHQSSMEAGERWMLNDVMGKPLLAWDSRGFERRMKYDALRRPTDLYVTENGVERLAEKIIYGEGQGDVSNHRTRVYQVKDAAGIVTSVAYDFKGNLQESKRELLPTYKQTVDWQQDPLPDHGTFTTRTTYDALNRPLTATSPDGSVYRPTFNEANLLDKVDVNLRGQKDAAGVAIWTSFVANINYNPKGQRELIAYGNGATTNYDYDEKTFRLTNLRTTRPAGLNGLAAQLFGDPTVVQDLRYTYDPVGNITQIGDAALKTANHDGQQIEPINAYTYDAIYRLIEAHGREHIGQTAHDFNTANGNYRDYPFAGLADFIAHPNDLQKLRNYTERYEYDEVGNFEFIRHIAKGGSWTRRYEYNEDSLIEGEKKSNRLTRTTVGNGGDYPEDYGYTDSHGEDVHGCMTAINNGTMVWDFKDQLQQVDLGGGGTAYYIYDASGQRVRKVIETQTGNPQKERIYLGGFEVYREYNGSGSAVMLERESLHIMDDKQRIALVETQTKVNGNAVAHPATVQRYQFANHLGSASLELTDDARLISYEEYHPYGTTSFQAGRSASELSLKRYRYTAKERDEESGFYYHGARYYAPWVGRWTSCDPLHAINLFSYASGTPTVLVDPSGKVPKIPEQYSDIGSYRAVRGDHVHQVATRTDSPGAKRTSASQHWEALSVSTKGASSADKRGQKVESAINRAAWGKDYRGKPAGESGKVTLTATGDTAVGKTKPAQPSQYLEDAKSYFKELEKGTPPNEAYERVMKSRSQLQEAAATPKRVPDASRSVSRELQKGQQLSVEAQPAVERSMTGGEGAKVTAENHPKGPSGKLGTIGKGVGVGLEAGMYAYGAIMLAREQTIKEQGIVDFERTSDAILEDYYGKYTITEYSIKGGSSKTYTNGVFAGTTVELNFFEFRGELIKRDEKYGYFDFSGDWVEGKVPSQRALVGRFGEPLSM
jgi:RHS repeat-associated protein